MVHEGSGVGAPACDVRGASSGYQLSVLGCGLKTFLLAFLTSSWYSPSGVRVLTEPGQNVPDWVAKVTIYWLPILEAQIKVSAGWFPPWGLWKAVFFLCVCAVPSVSSLCRDIWFKVHQDDYNYFLKSPKYLKINIAISGLADVRASTH